MRRLRLCCDLISGDLLCPLCGRPIEVIVQHTEDGWETLGKCAECRSLAEISLAEHGRHDPGVN